MLSWAGIDQPMKMEETPRDHDKKHGGNNKLDLIIGAGIANQSVDFNYVKKAA